MVYPIVHGMGPLPTTVAEIYKADMHVHIQGILDEKTMREWSKRNGLDFDSLAVGYHKQRWNGLKEYHPEYESLYGKLMRSENDYYYGVYEYLKRCAKQNTVLVEMSGSLRPPNPNKIDNYNMLKAVGCAFADAERDFGIKAGFIANIVRDFGYGLEPGQAMWVSELALELRDRFPFIVGLGMSGNENCHDQSGKELEGYVQAFELAHNEGLGCTIHAGETNLETLRKTLKLFNHCMDRIGHGIYALKADDLKVLKQYIRCYPKHRELHLGEPKKPDREPHCVLEFCPFAYEKLQSWNGEIGNVARDLWTGGFRITPGTDGPGPFKIGIENVYEKFSEWLGLEGAASTTVAAIKYSFLPEEQIKMLYMRASRQKHLLQHQSDAMAASLRPGHAAPALTL